MSDWTNATPTTTTSGVLRPEELGRYVETKRWPVSEGLALWVENYWGLRWDLPSGSRFASQTLPHPTCNLTVERGTHPRPGVDLDPVVVTGLVTRRFDVDVRGQGWVFGVKFRPGGLAALSGIAAVRWTDRVVPARSFLPSEVCDALAGLDPAEEPGAWIATTEAALDLLPRRPDRTYPRVLEVIADMLDDPGVVRVTQVEQRHGVSSRTLQRWFSRYVGAGPKWVLARYRMHDVVDAIDRGDDVSLTDLAHRYGWYDQAHFIRDFVSMVGVSPGRYRDRRRPAIETAGSPTRESCRSSR